MGTLQFIYQPLCVLVNAWLPGKKGPVECANKVGSLAGSRAGSVSGELSKAEDAASGVLGRAGRSSLRRASESQLMSLNTGN